MRSLVFLLCSAAFAQQYDVATVKVSQAQVNVSMLASPRANPFRVTNATLLELVRLAYETSFVTGPDWLGTARYDIAANAPAGANPEEGPARLRALLEERLGVKVHREKGERTFTRWRHRGERRNWPCTIPTRSLSFPRGTMRSFC